VAVQRFDGTKKLNRLVADLTLDKTIPRHAPHVVHALRCGSVELRFATAPGLLCLNEALRTRIKEIAAARVSLRILAHLRALAGPRSARKSQTRAPGVSPERPELTRTRAQASTRSGPAAAVSPAGAKRRAVLADSTRRRRTTVGTAARCPDVQSTVPRLNYPELPCGGFS
jgi:hypothetical protein